MKLTKLYKWTQNSNEFKWKVTDSASYYVIVFLQLTMNKCWINSSNISNWLEPWLRNTEFSERLRQRTKKSNKKTFKKSNKRTYRFIVECEGIRLCDVGPSVCVAIAQERWKAGQKDVSYYADRPEMFNKWIFMHFCIISFCQKNMNKMTRF